MHSISKKSLDVKNTKTAYGFEHCGIPWLETYLTQSTFLDFFWGCECYQASIQYQDSECQKEKNNKPSAIFKGPYLHLLKSLIARKVIFGLAVPKTMLATGPLVRLQRTSSYPKMATKNPTWHPWYRVQYTAWASCTLQTLGIKYNTFLKSSKLYISHWLILLQYLDTGMRQPLTPQHPSWLLVSSVSTSSFTCVDGISGSLRVPKSPPQGLEIHLQIVNSRWEFQGP